jgi:hypothetical protein
MKLHVNLNERALTTSPRSRAPVRSLSARRGDSLTIDVSFSMDGRTGPLPAGSLVSVFVYAGPGNRTALATGSTSTALNRGSKTVYRMANVSFLLSSLNTEFSSRRVVPLVFEVRIGNAYNTITTAPVTLNVSQTAS